MNAAQSKEFRKKGIIKRERYCNSMEKGCNWMDGWTLWTDVAPRKRVWWETSLSHRNVQTLWTNRFEHMYKYLQDDDDYDDGGIVCPSHISKRETTTTTTEIR